ncbi:response regulator transcription factor [Spongiibacter nanhainus]|uniref:Response regulator transcription factor n=1 Tax=Spongiibacter nanhainus TaxID=2794344 RepID=A0A7T4UP60_9GAMM|nr:response regulator transcription factor [Spongiibacter nanhainus]QQD17257.1 response regulator transcription factor [Spongiibacter nanhainus]
MRILLTEDDAMLGESVKSALTAEGYAVDWLTNGNLILPALTDSSHDLAILDVRLPGQSGIEALKSIREADIHIPVLLLTACDAIDDKVKGLDAGADDYLTKPFEMDELSARIRSLLRRAGSKTPKLTADALEVDPASHTVSYEGQAITDLTAKEFAVLEALLRNRGRFLTKSRLLECSNSWGEEVESNTVEVYISRLRKRFGKDKIETMRGVGYRFK